MVRIVGDALTFIWNICDTFPKFHNQYGRRGAAAAVLTALFLCTPSWFAALEIIGVAGYYACFGIPLLLTGMAVEFSLIRILFGSGGNMRHDWTAASALTLSFAMTSLLMMAVMVFLKKDCRWWFMVLLWSVPLANISVGLQLVFRIFGLKPREAVWATVPFLAEGGMIINFLFGELLHEVIS